MSGLLFGWMMSLAASASPCEAPVDLTSLESRMAEAEAAFVQLDAAIFLATSEALLEALPCAAQTAGPGFAARLHRLQAVRLWIGRQEQDALQAFAAARAADPALTVDGLVPPGHALRELFDRAATAPTTPPERLAPPLRGTLHLDGVPGRDRAPERPLLLQWVDGEAVELTAWVPPRAAPPPYEARRIPPPDVARRGRVLAAVGFGAAAAGAAMLGVAGALHADFEQEHPTWTREDLDARQLTTNSLTVTGSVLGGAGLALGAVGLTLAF